MESYATPALGRPLSADQQAAIRAFYKPTLASLIVLGLLLPLVFGVIMGGWFGIATDMQYLEDMVPVMVSIGVAVVVLAQLLLRWGSRRKMARAEFIYQYGQPENITFVSLTSGEYRKNSTPPTIINLLRGTEPLKIETYDERIIAAFMPPQQVAYTHPRYPNVLVPGSLFTPGWATGAGSRPRVVEV